MSEKIKAKELDEKAIKKLIEKIEDEGSEEAKYILLLCESESLGTAFDESWHEVILGKVKRILIQRRYGPNEDSRTYALIPLTLPVVVRWCHRWDYYDDQGYEEYLHVFTNQGWRSIKIR